ncbi:hypothetical protein B0T26DRAFT_638285 [Lasiosphaeria miniovina]|uniref:Ketoreductase domain-containing protein n=1 Tax=Lasiosphaeria miniovina TaxID=1954250 RepID=A0AA40B3M9_9PEZI|nr:uncharacterized protein B0T26DRAFT_638285 [Lasiosphaeria miniovina]KAK0726990.1 hypothetical protein B0T26DRAFT_638285 [Lasiosphaeria miniovina]
MSRPLEGKFGIITGGSRGIGAAIASNLASKGCNLVLNHASASSAALTATFCAELASAHGIRAVGVQADVGTAEGASAIVAFARESFASPTSEFQIDILVNNAGIALNAPLPAITAHEFSETYRVNVLGPLLVTQAVEPFLPRNRTGRVVNISSVSSSAGFVGQTVYGGTKAALEAMTRTWARELAERATVNAINPGPVEGPLYASNSPEFLAGIKGWIMHTPSMAPRPGVDSPEVIEEAKEGGGRLAHTSEIAGIVGMLCTPDAAWCTGQVVCANGGMMMLH